MEDVGASESYSRVLLANLWKACGQCAREGAGSHIPSPLAVQGKVAAFFVADLGAVVRRHFCFLKYLPRVRPFYAVRCNSSLGVLKVLAELGLGFSCANKVSPSAPTLMLIQHGPPGVGDSREQEGPLADHSLLREEEALGRREEEEGGGTCQL